MPDLTQEQKIALLDEVMQDKPLYRQIVRKVAERHPETYIPEVELGNEVDALRQSHADSVASMQAELQAERDARTAAEAMLKVKQEHGLNDKDVIEVTKFMAENQISDLDKGLKFMRLSEADAARTAQQKTGDRSTMALPAGFEEALKDRRSYRRKNLYQGLAEVNRALSRADRLATQ